MQIQINLTREDFLNNFTFHKGMNTPEHKEFLMDEYKNILDDFKNNLYNYIGNSQDKVKAIEEVNQNYGEQTVRIGGIDIGFIYIKAEVVF